MKQPKHNAGGKTISLNGYSVTIVEASTLMGMRHTVLVEEGREQVKPDDDPAMIYLKRITYPDLIAGVKDSSGFSSWPVPFDEFIELPEQFTLQWERAAYELNPHWRRGWEPATPEEKKEPTSGLSDGSAGS